MVGGVLGGALWTVVCVRRVFPSSGCGCGAELVSSVDAVKVSSPDQYLYKGA